MCIYVHIHVCVFTIFKSFLSWKVVVKADQRCRQELQAMRERHRARFMEATAKLRSQYKHLAKRARALETQLGRNSVSTAQRCASILFTLYICIVHTCVLCLYIDTVHVINPVFTHWMPLRCSKSHTTLEMNDRIYYDLLIYMFIHVHTCICTLIWFINNIICIYMYSMGQEMKPPSPPATIVYSWCVGWVLNGTVLGPLVLSLPALTLHLQGLYWQLPVVFATCYIVKDIIIHTRFWQHLRQRFCLYILIATFLLY